MSQFFHFFFLFFFFQRDKQRADTWRAKQWEWKRKNTWNSFQFELIWINDFCCKRYAWSKCEKRLTIKCKMCMDELPNANRKSQIYRNGNVIFFFNYSLFILRIDGLLLSSFAVANSSSVLLQFAIHNHFNYNVKARKNTL